jgi:uncharacterized protein YdaU (DUF1376 family)
MHYYKFNISDWKASTGHLTPEEEGIYFRLINHYYDTESPIPLETGSVIRRLMLGSQVDTVRSILDEFFIKTDRGYEKEKCNELIKEYKKTASKNRKNGALGGRPSKTKASSVTQPVSSELAMGTQTEPKHNPNQEPITINQEPITINQEPLTTKQINKVKTNRFCDPSLDEVICYFREKGSFDPTGQGESFFNFYESKGWYVGKTKMKSWRAAASGWISRSKLNGNKPSNQYLTANEKAGLRAAATEKFESLRDLEF